MNLFTNPGLWQTRLIIKIIAAGIYYNFTMHVSAVS
jgi:hypothetical protein